MTTIIYCVESGNHEVLIEEICRFFLESVKCTGIRTVIYTPTNSILLSHQQNLTTAISQ